MIGTRLRAPDHRQKVRFLPQCVSRDSSNGRWAATYRAALAGCGHRHFQMSRFDFSIENTGAITRERVRRDGMRQIHAYAL